MFGMRRVSPAKICCKFLYLLQRDSHNNEGSIMPMGTEDSGKRVRPLIPQPLRGEGTRMEKRLYCALIAVG